jgi:hypothetical protein
MYGSEAMALQELKHRSPRASSIATLDVDESTSKDLIDGDRVLVLEALNKYQARTKAWHINTVIPKNSRKETSPHQNHQNRVPGQTQAQMGRAFHRQDKNVPQRLQTHITIR